MHHLEPPLLGDVLDGRISIGAFRNLVLAHLRELCPECRRALDELDGRLLAAPEVPRASSPAHTSTVALDPQHLAVFSGVENGAAEWVRLVSRERRRAKRDLHELLKLPTEARRRRIENARTRFRSRGLAELLLAESKCRVATTPEESESLAALVPVVLLWTPGAIEKDWASIMCYRAEAWRANAARVAGHLRRATKLFAQLRAKLAAGDHASAGLLAEVARLEASLELDHGKYSRARHLLSEAASHYRQEKDWEGLASVLVKQGIVERRVGEPEKALATHQAALDLTREHPAASGVAASAVANIALVLCELGRYVEAAALLGEHGEICAGQAGTGRSAFLKILQGRVAWGLGQPQRAEALLMESRNEFITQRNALYAAVVSLDLAVLYLEEGRIWEVKRMARLVGELFQAEQVDPMLMASVVVFQTAAAREELTVAAVRELQKKLEITQRGLLADVRM